MKVISKIAYFYIVLSIVLFSNLHSLSSRNEETEFAIYLVENCSECSCDPTAYNLDDLELYPHPLITSNDLISYNWNDHKLSFKDSISNQLKDVLQKDSAELHNKFFVVVAGNQRIYLGVIWYAFSSQITCHPYISMPFVLRRIRFAKDFGLFDPRNDERIHKALRKDGILVE